jgi:outer membrane protein assembly factor BamD (BamD/ComL family)
VAVERVTGQAKQQSEIDLLRSARAALASRPREAYQLTEQHRNLYPQGVFTQEREALAVEALLRTGDLKLARELAEVFVKRYPSSPHAHRFREAMQLP